MSPAEMHVHPAIGGNQASKAIRSLLADAATVAVAMPIAAEVAGIAGAGIAAAGKRGDEEFQ